MTITHKGKKFWHCRHVFEGRALLTFGRTKWAAENRMTAFIARITWKACKANGEQR